MHSSARTTPAESCAWLINLANSRGLGRQLACAYGSIAYSIASLQHFFKSAWTRRPFGSDPWTREQASSTPHTSPTIVYLVGSKQSASCNIPVVCKAHEAKVASHGLFNRMVITSPNTDYILPYPVETMIVETYKDGRWSMHEYSRTPQRLAPGMWHIACIPQAPSPPEIPEVLFSSLSAAVDWKEDPRISFNGLGYIQDDTRRLLVGAAEHAICRFEEISAEENVRKYGQMLVVILQQVLDRMHHLPASATVSIDVTAHVQRICLELAGLRTYIEIVASRMASPADYSLEVLPVLGAFVVEGSEAMDSTRVGLPMWFLQPLTAEIPVWAVVDSRPLPLSISGDRMDPPILQRAQTLVGVGNLTRNWKESMLLTVSRHVAGTHLGSLCSVEVPMVPDAEPHAKHPRVYDDSHRSTHLQMSAAKLVAPPSGAKRTHRPRHRGKGNHASGGMAHPDVANRGNAPAARMSDLPHPSKSYVPSPFYDLVGSWENVLHSVGTVPHSSSSALYFFPPPFLLDTVSSIAPLPTECLHPECVRADEKTHRYLHNIVRIRRFLRARLFDPSLVHKPLSITEWRAVLWGKYATKAFAPSQLGSLSDFRHAYRRQGERNGVRRLFSRVAQLRSYRADDCMQWGADTLDLAQVASSNFLCRCLLWGSHEINFRAEVMALDTLLVHKSSWLEIHRWEREALVSGIWGPSTSAVTVIPADDDAAPPFHWSAPAPGACPFMARWPECPDEIFMDSERVQAQVVEFYVYTFIKHYSRLPVPPIAYIPCT
ncbi:hypothetical protein C8T65DRAFT_707531 [Cerioporus squamosus]|nr:hypothetical protein C8T65DRAFT_707531 [Cerioporus squamosus]